MFAKVAIALSTLAVLATAIPTPDGGDIVQCNTGDAQCCNGLYKTSNEGVATLLGLIGVDVQSVTAQVGLGCTAVTVIGVNGVKCPQQPVCCQENKLNGLVNINCSPVSA